MPIISLFLQPSLLLPISEATKDSKGNMQEVVHFGPGFDGSHNVVVTHPEVISMITNTNKIGNQGNTS